LPAPKPVKAQSSTPIPSASGVVCDAFVMLRHHFRHSEAGRDGTSQTWRSNKRDKIEIRMASAADADVPDTDTGHVATIARAPSPKADWLKVVTHAIKKES
jgi:hypothetical protein